MMKKQAKEKQAAKEWRWHAHLAPRFGTVKQGPLSALMVLWCFHEKCYSIFTEKKSGWACFECEKYAVCF